MGNVTRILRLTQLTEAIYNKASLLDAKMDNNRSDDLEMLLELFADRQAVIEEVDKLMKQLDFEWTAEERKIAVRLKILDQKLQPLLNGLYHAYKIQIERINQTKQMSVKYKNSYQNASVDGTFFDARK